MTSAATSQRQKLSATGSKTSRTARPITQLPDQHRLARTSSAKAARRRECTMAGLELGPHDIPRHAYPGIVRALDEADFDERGHIRVHILVVTVKAFR